MAWEARDKGPVKQGLAMIPAMQWRKMPHGTAYNDFWKTGDVRFFHGTLTGYPPGVAFRFYDVRFEPFGIEALLPLPKPSPPAGTVLSANVEIVAKEATDSITPLALELANGSEAPLVKIPKSVETKPISPVHLNAWWTFYKAVTLPSIDTEAYAIAHFRRCFPENNLPRQKIRDLRGAQKSGPKPKTAQ